MRSEDEVRRMLAALDAYPRKSQVVAMARALLRNVLNGPTSWGDCGCMGPAEFCVCQAAALGKADKKINNANLPGKYEDQDSEP